MNNATDVRSKGSHAAGHGADAVRRRCRGFPGAGMRRILDRETRSSRAGVSGIAAVLVVVLCGYGLLEAAVRAIGQPPWLIDPETAAERIIALPQGISPLLLGAIGAVTGHGGAVLLPQCRAARAPGPASAARTRRAGVVVDDEVIASALARRARLAANVTQEQVMVVVSQRQVTVNVRPTSGVPVSENAVLASVLEELREMAPAPMPEVRVNVATSGVIGA